MKRLFATLMSAVGLLLLALAIHAQDLLVPAGTLLQCTLDEPNFSSATAAIGDPVLCRLRTMRVRPGRLSPGQHVVDTWKPTRNPATSLARAT